MLKKTTYFIFLLTLLLAPLSIFANQVPIEEAARIAKDVFARNTSKLSTNNRSVQNVRVLSQFTKPVNEQAGYYIFNLQPTGFVIISAEDRYNPVLAFSDESHINFEAEETNIGLWGNLSKHEQRIQYIREKNLAPAEEITKEWRQLRNGTATRSARRNAIVGPLTTTKWDQGELYNAVCPASEATAEGPDGRTYCGCVPIAMAQLIKYHNFPAQGQGANQYVDTNFGTLDADFCSTSYNWANMPDELSEPNADVSQLIYQMGVASNTQYSTEYTETYFSYVRDAFVEYFGYNNGANWFYDRNYDQFAIVAKQDLDKGLPLLLTGTSKNLVGHTWVTDGYGYFSESDKAEYFHFNWGWGGSNNGWFLDSGTSWAPLEGQGNGVQEIVYYWDRFVLHNVFPASKACKTPNNETYADGVESIYARLYMRYTLLKGDEISFRYRIVGANDWIYTDVITHDNELLTNLQQGTQYEFQGRKKCCNSDWSGYTDTKTFTTAGQRVGPDPTTGPDPTDNNCSAVATTGLTTSSIGDANAYMYTTQPNGAINNQFRYRLVGTTAWATTDISSTYYRYLSNLSAGSQYEFQAKQECAAGVWSDYSASQQFTTTGQANNTDGGNTDNGNNDNGNTDNGNNDNGNTNNNCSAVAATGLTISSIGNANAYIYTIQPSGATNNQFRYRIVGTSTWTTSDISTTYYRYLSGLKSGSQYEFQAKQECAAGVWSGYSTSQQFMTTGQSDELITCAAVFFADTDGDGYGDESNTISGCSAPSGYVNNADDCDDTDATIPASPGTACTDGLIDADGCTCVVSTDGGNNGNGNNGNNGNGNNGNNGNGNNGDANCSALTADGFFVSSVSQSAAYAYTAQPLGVINNQFRHRVVGTNNWTFSGIQTAYYRYLSNLSAGTTYEYQVSHECEANAWSDFSPSFVFSTTSNFTDNGTRARPHSYAAFRQLATNSLREDLAIYPNPALHEITVRTNQVFQEGATLIIYNTQGSIVQTQPLNPQQSQQRINIAALNAGIYLIQYQTMNGIQSKKFVKK